MSVTRKPRSNIRYGLSYLVNVNTATPHKHLIGATSVKLPIVLVFISFSISLNFILSLDIVGLPFIDSTMHHSTSISLPYQFQGYKNVNFGCFEVALDRPKFDRTQQCLLYIMFLF